MSIRSLPENAAWPSAESLELGPEERRRFLNALIRQILFRNDLDPRKNAARIRDESKRTGIPVAEVMAAWKLRFGQFEKYMKGTRDEGSWLDFRPADNITANEFNRFRAYTKVKSPRAYEGYDEEDFTMDLLTKLLQDQPDFLLPEYGADATAWAKTVIYNHGRHARRDENRHQRILHQAAYDPEHWLGGGRLGESAERTVLRHLDEMEIERAIFRLPKHLSQVAYLRYQGDSYAEIGWALGINENTVKMRLRTIRSPRIRAVLGL